MERRCRETSKTCNNHEVGVQGPLLKVQQFLGAQRDVQKPKDMVCDVRGDGLMRSDMWGK
jgi:hypothetical protein